MIHVLLLPILIAAAADATIPDSPRGRHATAFLGAWSRAERAGLEAFVVAHFDAEDLKRLPSGPRAERLSGLAREIGPLTLRRYAESAEGVMLLAESGSHAWYEARLEMAPRAPFGILGIDVEKTDADAIAEGPKPSDAEVAQAAAGLLRKRAEAGEFAGVVLLARDGRPFFHEAYGLAERAFAAPNRPDTKFNIGSINKIVTKIAIAQLLARGKLRLDDTIREHLPDYPAEPGGRITIRQLVTMSSGLGDVFGPGFEATSKDRLRTLQDYLPLFVGQPLRFAPGQGRAYSNAGYVVLGLIVERASGQGYHEYVGTQVYAPAGMTDTDAYELDAVTPNRATGYTREGGGPWRQNVYGLPARGSAAGGGYSTAADLLKLDQALRADRLLDPAFTDWVLSDASQDPKPGPSPRGRKRGGAVGWAGGTAGANAVVEIDLATGATLIVLSNLDPPSAEQVAKRIRRWLPRRE